MTELMNTNRRSFDMGRQEIISVTVTWRCKKA